MVDLFLPLLRNTGLLAVVALVYGLGIARLPQRHWNAFTGLVCGVGAIFAMLDPTEIMTGVLVDSRTTMVALGAFFGGPVGAVIAGGIAGAYRLYLGGIGAPAGATVIAVASIMGVIGHYIFVSGEKRTRIIDVQIFALFTPLLSVGLFVLPMDLALELLQKTFFPLNGVRVGGTIVLGMMILHEQHRVIAEKEVRRLAFVDELSGVPNRRAFYSHLDRAWARWKRYGNPFSIVMIDIDRFKMVNDTYGHPAGDEVIKRLAQILLEESRDSDIAARLGGEEFALLLSNTTSDGGVVMAERIRKRIENELVEYDGSVIGFTISAGLNADLTETAIRRDPLASADQALYEAKRNGRNRVVKGFPNAADRDPPPVLRPPTADKPLRAVARSVLTEAPR